MFQILKKDHKNIKQALWRQKNDVEMGSLFCLPDLTKAA